MKTICPEDSKALEFLKNSKDRLITFHENMNYVDSKLVDYYVYQIMVTFECTFMQMIKNAMLCAIAHLPMAVFHTVLSAAIIVVMSFAVYPGIVIVFDFVAGLCLTRYPMEFYATRVLEKMIKLQKKQAKAKITYMSEEE